MLKQEVSHCKNSTKIEGEKRKMIMLRSTNTKVYRWLRRDNGIQEPTLPASSDMKQRRISRQERAWRQNVIPRVTRYM